MQLPVPSVELKSFWFQGVGALGSVDSGVLGLVVWASGLGLGVPTLRATRIV